MILLTRFDKRQLALNCDLIESIDARPDTTIRLVNGQSLVVRESVEDVVERIRSWRASLLKEAGAGALVNGTLSSVLRPAVEGALAELGRQAPDDAEAAA